MIRGLMRFPLANVKCIVDYFECEGGGGQNKQTKFRTIHQAWREKEEIFWGEGGVVAGRGGERIEEMVLSTQFGESVEKGVPVSEPHVFAIVGESSF